MADNTFNAKEEYLPIIDRGFEVLDVTNVFGNDTTYVGNGQYRVLKVTVGGLGNYERYRDNDGNPQSYAKNHIATDWEIIKGDQERSTQIAIDKMDNMEAFGLAFDEAIRQFIMKAAYERMARRHAAIASNAKVAKAGKEIDTAAELIAELRKAVNYFARKHVPTADRVLIVDVELLGLIEDMNSYQSTAVLKSCGQIIPVSNDTLDSKITLSATDAYTVDEDSQKINFMLINKRAVCSGSYYEVEYFDKNSGFLGSLFNYYEYPLNAYIYDNMADGVYVNLLPTDMFIEVDSTDFTEGTDSWTATLVESGKLEAELEGFSGKATIENYEGETKVDTPANYTVAFANGKLTVTAKASFAAKSDQVIKLVFSDGGVHNDTTVVFDLGDSSATVG